MSKKRSIVLLMIVALLLSSIAAITNAQDNVTITLMGGSSGTAENDALQAMVDAFEAANPNVTVDVQLLPDFNTVLQAAFASGEPPNVFYVDSSNLPDLVEAGAIAPAGDNLTDLEGVYPSLLDVFTINGELYCPPKDFSTLALQYNKDMFDEASLDYPTADWTWEDLRAAAEALTTDDHVGLVVPPELERWMAFMYQAGGSILNDDNTEMTFNSEEVKAALDFYVGMVEDGIAAPPSDLDAGWGGEAFGKGNAAMGLEGNWVIQYLLDTYPDLNWGVAELPAGPAGKATMAFTVCYGVAAANEHPEESWALVNFLTGEEGAMMVAEAGFGVMPARSSAAETWLAARGVEYQAFVAGADYAHRWQLPPGFNEFKDAFNNTMKEVMGGNLTTEELVEDTVEVGEEVLSR